jgi:hypothetical protein
MIPLREMIEVTRTAYFVIPERFGHPSWSVCT